MPVDGAIDDFVPDGRPGNFQSRVYPNIDLQPQFQNLQYTIDSGLKSISFAFASSGSDEVVGIDSPKITCDPLDADGDGIANAIDECPGSVLSPTVVIGECDSGIPNTLFSSGCSISDDVNLCAAGASTHGEFVSCIAHHLNDLMKAGILAGKRKGAIQECSAKAIIP